MSAVSENPLDFCKKNSLLVVHSNADTIGTKLTELSDFLCKEGVDVCLIQESKLSSMAKTPRAEGNIILRKDRPARGGGLLIFIQDDIPSRTLM